MNITEVFKALGDTVRLSIVELLAEKGELCVCHIVDELQMGQPLVSHHLARLKAAGIVTAKKRRQWVDYSLNTDMLETEVAVFFDKLIREARSDKPEVAKRYSCEDVEVAR